MDETVVEAVAVAKAGAEMVEAGKAAGKEAGKLAVKAEGGKVATAEGEAAIADVASAPRPSPSRTW